MRKLTTSEINEEVINEWKKSHPVFKYVAEDGKTAFFRSPERKEIEAANSIAARQPLESNAILAKAAFLGGDEEIITIDKYFYGLSGHLKEIIKKVEGELTEL